MCMHVCVCGINNIMCIVFNMEHTCYFAIMLLGNVSTDILGIYSLIGILKEIHADRLFVFLISYQIVLGIFTVRIAIQVEMWLDGVPHVVVGTF